MEKTIWYGVKDNEARFADNQQTLTEQGINNCSSFTVDGEVSGLNLSTNETAQQSHGTQQTA